MCNESWLFDPEFCQRGNGMASEFASEELRGNEEIMTAAVRLALRSVC